MNINFLNNFKGVDIKFVYDSKFICSELDNFNFAFNISDLELLLIIHFKRIDLLQNYKKFEKNIVLYAMNYCYDIDCCDYIFKHTSFFILLDCIFQFSFYSVNKDNSLVIKSYFNILVKKYKYLLSHTKFCPDSKLIPKQNFNYCTCVTYHRLLCNCIDKNKNIHTKCDFCTFNNVCLHCGPLTKQYAHFTNFDCLNQEFKLFYNKFSDFFIQQYTNLICEDCSETLPTSKII